ncbi:hypothetical protein ACFFLZ_23240 [Photobacterium aphoticum]|uniref:hypothetical protein n=1 Tax=Photobacterium aphoticum TaxID=754436 RepID=UPI00069EFC6B|nr:hypothetical protein [Photobacterium aphoticum]PSU58100.1 hypothetical protein C9I90_07390 [Photobacterium aphoticum]GHA35963.1 hypothetical protein GCM10007086_06380 [Photobacterium aphoticum]
MTKRWVFQELVKNQENGNLDVIGYVAYALYKAKKDALATSLRKQNKGEEEIERRLREFHENTVINTQECAELRTRAEQVIGESIQIAIDDIEKILKQQLEDAKSELISEFDKKKKDLDKDREKFEKEKRTLSTKIRKEETNKLSLAAKSIAQPNRLHRSAIWLWNGFSGLIATILTGILIYGVLVYFGNNETKQSVLINALQWLVNSLTNNPLPSA